MWWSEPLLKPQHLQTEPYFLHWRRNWNNDIKQHWIICLHQVMSNFPVLPGCFSPRVRLTVKTCCNILIGWMPLRGWHCRKVLRFPFTRTDCWNWLAKAGKWVAGTWQNSPAHVVMPCWFVLSQKQGQRLPMKSSNYTNVSWVACSAGQSAHKPNGFRKQENSSRAS